VPASAYRPAYFAGGLGELHTLTLTLPARLVIVAGYLQRQFQQLLHRLQHYLRHDIRFRREIGRSTTPGTARRAPFALIEAISCSASGSGRLLMRSISATTTSPG
jgi:hypothetical protein